MRLEKPHSLSYQLMTRTRVPSMTLVWSIWKVDEWGSWLKSIDTLGWSVQPRMPFSWLAAASFTALLISSLSVLRLPTNLKSIIETLGVGTRIATPSSLPLSSGSTRPTALAAPVEVGIIDSAAAVEVLVHGVERRLVACVGVDRGHESMLDADRVVQHLDDRRQAVGRAR